MKSMSVDVISVLRFIAAILIINSHSGALYPDGLSFLATGGSIGNSLFFFCSGYGLLLSNRKIGFTRWFSKRLIRIYPTVWIFLLVLSIVEKECHAIDFIITPFWFVNAITVFYFLFYWIAKYFSDKLLLIIGVLLLPYLSTFFLMNNYLTFVIENTKNVSYLHWYYYFAIMLFGAFCSKQQIPVNFKTDIFYLLITIVGYYSLKAMVMHYHSISVIQICLPLFLLVISRQSYLVAKWVADRCKNSFCLIVNYISKLTLDIYVVQFTIIGYYANTDRSSRLLLSFITIIIVAELLSRCSSWARKPLNVIFKL